MYFLIFVKITVWFAYNCILFLLDLQDLYSNIVINISYYLTDDEKCLCISSQIFFFIHRILLIKCQVVSTVVLAFHPTVKSMCFSLILSVKCPVFQGWRAQHRGVSAIWAFSCMGIHARRREKNETGSRFETGGLFLLPLEKQWP